eukprot:m.252026 g.252026  ORF g.252026 m.252026 type:complete len:386 (+) comp54516_c0_seq2:4327-5484(+)
MPRTTTWKASARTFFLASLRQLEPAPSIFSLTNPCFKMRWRSTRRRISCMTWPTSRIPLAPGTTPPPRRWTQARRTTWAPQPRVLTAPMRPGPLLTTPLPVLAGTQAQAIHLATRERRALRSSRHTHIPTPRTQALPRLATRRRHLATHQLPLATRPRLQDTRQLHLATHQPRRPTHPRLHHTRQPHPHTHQLHPRTRPRHRPTPPHHRRTLQLRRRTLQLRPRTHRPRPHTLQRRPHTLRRRPRTRQRLPRILRPPPRTRRHPLLIRPRRLRTRPRPPAIRRHPRRTRPRPPRTRPHLLRTHQPHQRILPRHLRVVPSRQDTRLPRLSTNQKTPRRINSTATLFERSRRLAWRFVASRHAKKLFSYFFTRSDRSVVVLACTLFT